MEPTCHKPQGTPYLKVATDGIPVWLVCVDDKIQQLLDSLEMQKDESIERTFKGVAKNFR